MAKIFISYRREDSQWPAHKLYDTIRPLVAEPDKDVFIDVDNIPLGVNFSQHLDGKVAQCDYLLAVIGPHWLSVTNPETGARRLDDPADFVRIEIASALARGIPVIPVLMDGAKLPAPLDLPEDLRELPLRNGVEVRHLSFEHDVERLLAGLGLPKRKPMPTEPEAWSPQPELVRKEPDVSINEVKVTPPAFTHQGRRPTTSKSHGPYRAVGALLLVAIVGAGVYGVSMLRRSPLVDSAESAGAGQYLLASCNGQEMSEAECACFVAGLKEGLEPDTFIRLARMTESASDPETQMEMAAVITPSELLAIERLGTELVGTCGLPRVPN